MTRVVAFQRVLTKLFGPGSHREEQGGCTWKMLSPCCYSRVLASTHATWNADLPRTRQKSQTYKPVDLSCYSSCSLSHFWGGLGNLTRAGNGVEQARTVTVWKSYRFHLWASYPSVPIHPRVPPSGLLTRVREGTLGPIMAETFWARQNLSHHPKKT